MRKTTITLLLAMASAVCGAQSGNSMDPYLTKSFSDASFQKIHAGTSHGNIELSAISGTETKVEVFIQGRQNNITLGKEQTQQLFDEYYSLDIAVSGDVLNVVAHQKKMFFTGNRSLSISFKIHAGKEKSTELETDHGNLSLSGMTGTQELTTDHGNIEAENILGHLTAKTDHGNIIITGSKEDVDAKTDHGDIELKEAGGKVKLVTSNGNIKLTNVTGNIRTDTDHGNIEADLIGGDLMASTSHGDINLDRLSCAVEASTDHGNLSVNFDKIAGNVVLKNSSGDISLRLPKGNPIDLDIRGRRVVIKAIENFSGTQENEYIRGSLNGGGTKVVAKTDKGQVDLAFK